MLCGLRPRSYLTRSQLSWALYGTKLSMERRATTDDRSGRVGGCPPPAGARRLALECIRWRIALSKAALGVVPSRPWLPTADAEYLPSEISVLECEDAVVYGSGRAGHRNGLACGPYSRLPRRA